MFEIDFLLLVIIYNCQKGKNCYEYIMYMFKSVRFKNMCVFGNRFIGELNMQLWMNVG